MMASTFRMLILFLALGLMVCGVACDSDDDDDDDNDARDTCEDGEPLAIDATDRDEGLNLVEQQVTLSGGCFDENTTAALAAPDGQEWPLEVVTEYPSTLTATIPAGVPLGEYAIRVDRGDLSAETDYDAISDIIVSGANEGRLYIVDMTDRKNPAEVASFEPWPGDWTKWSSHPSVNYQGTKAYFWGYEDEVQSAIYVVDLPDGGNVTKITDDSVLHFHTPDASPTEGVVTFLGCTDVGDVCDIYTANEDGTDVQMIADHLDTVLVNGDNTSSWGLWEPVFSPDGEKIAFFRETVCEGSTEPNCDYDWYSVVMIMNADGTDKQVVAWEPQARFYDYLHWTSDNYLVWKRTDDDASPQQLVAMKVDGGAVYTIDPPDGSWDSGWNGGGDGFVWLTYSPLDDAIVLQPFNTASMYYYPLTIGPTSGSAGEGWALDVPDGEGGTFAHYLETDWFGWRP